jgi:membrane-bound lytic murein transglycosylase MltF
MTTSKAIDEDDIDEHDIATAAAHILRERFITVSRTETVFYVKNDIVWSKAPNDSPVFIKQLSGRNLDLSKSSLVAEHLNLKNGIKHFAILVN